MTTRAMHADSGKDGGRASSRQHVRRGADEARRGWLWCRGWPQRRDDNIVSAVQDVLRDLHHHWSRPTVLRLSKGFSDRRPNVADACRSRAKSRGGLEQFELSTQLVTEAALLFHV